ncbi:LysR family transcriptional regulator [Dasania marina]|uniref:LysR family transcriptional regulator n=1 Tax=Dasania marina TaxID=471499 RepID=UPI000382A38F|nr:LysR family transcriptional regulator [Dasania marina]
MDRFHQLKVYVAVAEEQGFAAAARRLVMSPPAVTRAVAELEDQLGVKLLNRTTRYVRATEAGLRYLEDARRILQELATADEAAAGINSEPQGHLVVTAPVLFGCYFVTPGIVDYLNRYPKMDVDAVFLDRVVNLLEEGLDVGVRIGELPDSSMRALRVGSVRLLLCASPSYIAQHGLPKHPSDLLNHTIIASKAGSGAMNWRFPIAGKDKLIAVKPRLTVTTNDAAIEATTQGFGITRVLSYQVAKQLVSGELKIIMENYEPAAKPVHIVHREGRNAAVKVRAFVDLLAEKLRSEKALN